MDYFWGSFFSIFHRFFVVFGVAQGLFLATFLKAAKPHENIYIYICFRKGQDLRKMIENRQKNRQKRSKTCFKQIYEKINEISTIFRGFRVVLGTLNRQKGILF